MQPSERPCRASLSSDDATGVVRHAEPKMSEVWQQTKPIIRDTIPWHMARSRGGAASTPENVPFQVTWEVTCFAQLANVHRLHREFDVETCTRRLTQFRMRSIP